MGGFEGVLDENFCCCRMYRIERSFFPYDLYTKREMCVLCMWKWCLDYINKGGFVAL